MLTSSIVIISITLFHFTKSQELYGLTRAKNNNQTCSGAPSGCTQLVSISSQTGTIKNIGIPVQTLAAVGDLGAIDSWNGIYYFLGDGWNGTGTVLVALSLNDGSEMCKTNLNDRIKTVGIVGGEMSLNIIQKKVFVTGLSSSSGPHVILVSPLSSNGCPSFEQIGQFPYSGSLPIAHSSEISASNDDLALTLYTTVAMSPHTYGIDMINLENGQLNRSINMVGRNDVLWSPTFVNGKLCGPAEDGFGNLDWRTVTVTGNAAWTSAPLKYANATWNTLWGNLGSIRAYNNKDKMLHVLVSQGKSEKIHLSSIDVTNGKMNANPVMLNGDTGYSGEILLQMVLRQ
jgi:hypothetical protein